MWTLEQVRAEYHRLDRLLGIDTSGIPVRFSKRMTRQYGVCTFLKNRPQERTPAAARHGRRLPARDRGCPERGRLAPQCAAAEENRKRIAAARGVYVVTCLGCGAESRYLRRGKVVQALEEKRGQIRCRRCGGKKFRLEKRYEQEEHEQ